MMNTEYDHLTRFLPVACAGFGLLLAGGVNLLLLRRGLTARLAATAGALGLGLAAAAALDQPGTVASAGRILALGIAPCLLLGSRRFVDGAAGLVTALHRPAVRYGLLTAAGVGTVLGGLVFLDRMEEKAAADTLADLELAHGRGPTVPSATHKACTARGTPVVLKEPAAPGDSSTLTVAEEKILRGLRDNDQIIRRGPATDRSNCHGWVFAGGRFLLSPDDVELILKENGYHEVVEPQAGDLVVYRQGGTIAHTAVVRYVTEGQPVLVEGKWGTMGVFLHPADRGIYGTDYTFYRSDRPGHTLAGLGGPADPAGTAAARPAMATE